MRIILCGFGVVAQSFSKLLETRTHELYSKFGVNPRIIGVFDSKGCAYNESGLDLKKLNKTKEKTGSVRGYDKSIKLTYNLKNQIISKLKKYGKNSKNLIQSLEIIINRTS